MIKLLKKSKIVIWEKQARKDDPRLRNIIKSWDGKSKIDVGIIGVPFDYGVELSGGRTGASLAPDAIRGQLKRYGTAYNIEKGADISKLKIADLGNVKAFSRNSLRTHSAVTDALLKVYSLADTVIALGGGNDITYATVLALYKSKKQVVGGMNIDAHFDVRPVVNGKINSGTPYRRLFEDKIISGKNFWEVGIQGHVNSIFHERWLKKQGAKIIFLSETRKKGIASVFKKFESSTKNCKALFVSIDIDSVAQSFAPGSSAPSPDGFFPEVLLQLAFLAGLNPKVKLFEIMEVNPKYDIDNRTNRLSANIIAEFLAGRSLVK